MQLNNYKVNNIKITSKIYRYQEVKQKEQSKSKRQDYNMK